MQGFEDYQDTIKANQLVQRLDREFSKKGNEYFHPTYILIDREGKIIEYNCERPSFVTDLFEQALAY